MGRIRLAERIERRTERDSQHVARRPVNGIRNTKTKLVYLDISTKRETTARPYIIHTEFLITPMIVRSHQREILGGEKLHSYYKVPEQHIAPTDAALIV